MDDLTEKVSTYENDAMDPRTMAAPSLQKGHLRQADIIHNLLNPSNLIKNKMLSLQMEEYYEGIKDLICFTILSFCFSHSHAKSLKERPIYTRTYVHLH